MPHEKRSNVSPHVIVMTDAGKVIFSTWSPEDHEQLSNVCGLVQALKASTVNDEALDYGEILFLKMMNSIICLWDIGAISLVAVSHERSNTKFNQASTEAYLRLILEQIYCGMIFLLTDSLQEQLIQNPNLDMAEMLGPTSSTLNTTLRGMGIDAGLHASESRYEELFTNLGGVDVFGPVPYEMRCFMSQVLTTVCSKYDSILFAIVIVKGKLFNLLQPHRKDFQILPFDLNMLLKFLEARSNLEGNELWAPICLPRLNQTGFVHAYNCSLVPSVTLSLISQNGSLEEFKMLQHVGREIRQCAGFETQKKPIMRIYSLDSNFRSSDEDLIWEFTNDRSEQFDVFNDAEQVTKQAHAKEQKIVCSGELRSNFQSMLLKVVRYNGVIRSRMMTDYCSMGAAVHFLFFLYTPVRHFKNGKQSGGKLSQCISPCKIGFVDELLKQRIYHMYHKMLMKLRFESSSVESTMDAMDAKISSCSKGRHDISQFCPSRLLHESIPPKGRSHLLNGKELYYCMSDGETFSSFATFSSTTAPAEANILCSVLVETIQKDLNRLFISDPLSF